MDAKFALIDVAQALARRANIPSAESIVFVRQFFDTIQEALLRDRYVKVRNLGTFKLISVEPRESINIADGSRIRISGHTKVTFVPDAILRDAVNKPFAEFETVILSDKLNLDDLENVGMDPMGAEEASSVEKPVLEENSPAEGDSIVEKENESTISEVTSLLEEPLTTVEVPASEEEAPQIVEAPASEEETPQIVEAPASEEETPQIVEAPASEEETPQIVEAPASEEEAPQIVEVPASEEEVPQIVEAPASEEDIPAVEETPNLDSKDVYRPESLAPYNNAYASNEPHDRFWCRTLCLVIISMLFFVAGYLVGYLRPIALPFMKTTTSAPPPSNPEEADDDELMGSSNLTEEDSVSFGLKSSSTSHVPQSPDAAASYPQLEGGDYWIVGVKATEVMKPGTTLLNFSLKHYGSKDFVDYICTMNDIQNPNVVSLNKELKIPELQKK